VPPLAFGNASPRVSCFVAGEHDLVDIGRDEVADTRERCRPAIVLGHRAGDDAGMRERDPHVLALFDIAQIDLDELARAVVGPRGHRESHAIDAFERKPTLRVGRRARAIAVAQPRIVLPTRMRDDHFGV
jgi:hypothetical protein